MAISFRTWAVAAAALVAVLGAVQFIGSEEGVRESGARLASLPSPSLLARSPGSRTGEAPSSIGIPAQQGGRVTPLTPATKEMRPIEMAFREYCSAPDEASRTSLRSKVLSDPFEAVPHLLAALQGPDPVRRRHAIALLGSAKDARASRPLARLLDDPACSSAAIQSLGEIGDPIARIACLRALRRDELRLEAVHALSRCADASLVDPLLRAVAEGVLTPGAAAEVGRMIPPVAGRSPLLSELRCADPARGDATAAILVECRDPAVRPFLEASFADRSARGWAATQLARLADPACVSPIVESARDPAAEEDALHVLRAIGGPAITALGSILRRGDRPVQRRAIRFLGRLGDSAATPPLLEAAADPELRSSAVAALIQCGDQRAAPLFLSVITDRRLAPEAIAALGAMREVSAIPALIPALRRREVRDEALEALRQITSEDFGLDAAQWARWWKSRVVTPRGGVSVFLERSRS